MTTPSTAAPAAACPVRRLGPLLAVLAVQLAILAAIPARQAWARLSETAVTLETGPVDPYDALSGYYVTLRYAAERSAPEGAAEGDPAWLVLAPASSEPASRAWTGVACSLAEPHLAPGQVALRASVERGTCRIVSAGRFYIPEARRQEVDAAMRAVFNRALVDLRVSEHGDVALVRLRAGALELGGE